MPAPKSDVNLTFGGESCCCCLRCSCLARRACSRRSCFARRMLWSRFLSLRLAIRRPVSQRASGPCDRCRVAVAPFHLRYDVNLIKPKSVKACLIRFIVGSEKSNGLLFPEKHELAFVLAHHAVELCIERFLLAF